MTIFSRIYKIIRSEVSKVLTINAPTNETGGNAGFSQDYPPRDNPGSNAHSANIPGKQDPALARYYANLEVPYGSDITTVRASWKKLLKRYHPDLHSDNPEKQQIAEELVKQLNHAYRELEKRLDRQEFF